VFVCVTVMHGGKTRSQSVVERSKSEWFLGADSQQCFLAIRLAIGERGREVAGRNHGLSQHAKLSAVH